MPVWERPGVSNRAGDKPEATGEANRSRTGSRGGCSATNGSSSAGPRCAPSSLPGYGYAVLGVPKLHVWW